MGVFWFMEVLMAREDFSYGFMFYASYFDAMCEMTSDQGRYELLQCMCSLAFDGVDAEPYDREARMMWNCIKPNVIASIKRNRRAKAAVDAREAKKAQVI